MLPSGFTQKLSGADKFQLLLDWQIRCSANAAAREGNVIRMSIEVSGKVELAELEQAVNLPFLQQINSLKIVGGFLKEPYWKYTGLANPVSITEYFAEEGNGFPAEVLNRDISINTGKLLHIDLIHRKTNSTLVFSAHHVVADNQGLQSLLKTIGGNLVPGSSPFAAEAKEKTSFLQKLSHVFIASLFIFRKSPIDMAVFPQPAESKTAFSFLQFSPEETARIESVAATNGARLSKTVFYLAATSKALKETFFADKRKTFLVAAPQNQRLRGNKNMSIGNQISFLFYTIPFKNLDNLTEATAGISKQMMEQAKQQMPKSYSIFLNAVRFLPFPVYNFFYKLPTLGGVSSFLFSDVGDTLAGMETFLGRKVLDVTNFAPNPLPPGIIVVFMKHAGALKVITTYNCKAISPEEIAKFEKTLKALLQH